MYIYKTFGTIKKNYTNITYTFGIITETKIKISYQNNAIGKIKE